MSTKRLPAVPEQSQHDRVLLAVDTFASIANSQHVLLYSICKALGHSSTAVTSQIYTHLFDETHQEVVDLVGQAIAKAK